jgi:hypothetical protein
MLYSVQIRARVDRGRSITLRYSLSAVKPLITRRAPEQSLGAVADLR